MSLLSVRYILPKWLGLTAVAGATASTTVLALKVQDHYANQVSRSSSQSTDTSSSSSSSATDSSQNSVDLSKIDLEQPGVPVDEDNFSV